MVQMKRRLEGQLLTHKPWFETHAFGALLTMRLNQLISSKPRACYAWVPASVRA
jgi:hypothetical protein